MRGIVLAVVAIQVGLAFPAVAENPTMPTGRSARRCRCFNKNHCEKFKDPAEQLFCGDPELNAAVVKLNGAIQDRLNRLANRRLAIEENAEWIKDRNSSCGINGQERFASKTSSRDRLPVEGNRGKNRNPERSEFRLSGRRQHRRRADLQRPVAGRREDGTQRARPRPDRQAERNEAKDAFAEYERWSRERDRKCDLVGKDNVPLDELSSSEDCLAEYLSQKTAEIVAAKGDPKRVFGRHPLSPTPNADAVDLCVGQIHAANTCEDFLTVSRVFEIDNEVTEQSALVTAEVEMVVLSPFAVCSPIASSCTGTCWDLKSGKPNPATASRESFAVAHRLRIEKAFAFQKTDSGGWRCNTTALQPVDFGVALGRR